MSSHIVRFGPDTVVCVGIVSRRLFGHRRLEEE